jgi:hypothetical protein
VASASVRLLHHRDRGDVERTQATPAVQNGRRHRDVVRDETIGGVEGELSHLRQRDVRQQDRGYDETTPERRQYDERPFYDDGPAAMTTSMTLSSPFVSIKRC